MEIAKKAKNRKIDFIETMVDDKKYTGQINNNYFFKLFTIYTKKISLHVGYKNWSLIN
jgi:hypothetical protein